MKRARAKRKPSPASLVRIEEFIAIWSETFVIWLVMGKAISSTC